MDARILELESVLRGFLIASMHVRANTTLHESLERILIEHEEKARALVNI